MKPPQYIKGGQGRDARDIEHGGWIGLALIAVAVVLTVVMAVGGGT